MEQIEQIEFVVKKSRWLSGQSIDLSWIAL